MPRIRATALAVCAAVGAVLSGCGTDDDEGPPTFATFERSVEEGASCPELFEIRNAWDPKDPAIEDANVILRRIGCNSSTSTRTDQ